MRLSVLDNLYTRHIRERLGGFADRGGQTDPSFTTILCQYLTEDIRTFADICGQRGWRGSNGIGFVLLSFSQPLLA
jgi:hypothetical protein